MRRASFSRQTHPNNNTTKCIHTVEAANGHIQDSIMSLCSHPSKPWLFAGTQTGTVLVINTQNFQLIHSLRCPNDETSGRPVLCMTFVSHKIKMNEEEIEMEEELLISGGSGDGVLRAWNLKTMELEFTIHAGHDCGDVYSMVYSPTANCLYISCKNQSIQAS